MPPQSLDMTADELHAYLCRSTLPTLLVEGKGDRGVLRKFGQLLASKSIDVLPVNGKLVLDAIHARRSALTGAPVAFMRDRDEFVVIGVPSGFGDYEFTSGYSLENDVLDKGTINKLSPETYGALCGLVTAFSAWFRSRLQNYVLVDRSLTLSTDVTGVLNGGVLTAAAASEVADTELVAPFSELDIDTDAWRWVRGKSLLRVIHSHFEGVPPRYSMDQLCDLCIRMGPSAALTDLANRILSRF